MCNVHRFVNVQEKKKEEIFSIKYGLKSTYMLHYQLSALFSLHSNEARKFQYKSHSIVYSMNENNETTYYLVRISILFILCKNKGTISNNLVGGGKKAVFIFFIFIELFSLFYKTLILYFFFSSFFLC